MGFDAVDVMEVHLDPVQAKLVAQGRTKGVGTLLTQKKQTTDM